jgi:methionyl-tRNA formyltransferase
MIHPFTFFGSDRFSAVVLSELVKQNHRPSLVVTDLPKPKGRKGEITPNEVDLLAKNHNLKVLYYQSNNEELINYINTHHSIGLSASFPHLFPPSIINAFDGRLYNLHPSLLPQYRNVAPGPYAIAMGDTVTGISLFPISVGIDNGELVAQQQEKILPTDSTTTLLTRLFTIGTQLFLKFLSDPNNPNLTAGIPVMSSSELIFTRKLNRESGFIEWDIVQKLINNKPITKDETSNPLIKLRLAHHPERTTNILLDLIRALDTYEKVWTIAETRKGEIIISLSLDPNNQKSVLVLVSGKPNPTTLKLFESNYL